MFLFLLLKILCMPSRRSVENSDKPEELVEWNALIKQLFSPIACFNWHIFQSCSNQTVMPTEDYWRCFRSWWQGKLILIAYGWPMNCQWTMIIDHCYKKAEKDWWEVFQGIRRHPFASFLFRVFTLLHPFTFPSSSASASLSVFTTYLFSFNSKESQYLQHQ